MSGWRDGLSAWSPVREGNRLYGRGSADDGYAAFASVAAIRALQEQDVSHARVVILIEFSEESGSPDLAAYMENLASVIGTPSLVIALDSGVSNYEQNLVDDVLERRRRLRAHSRGASRGGALGRWKRDRALVVPHRASSSLAARGRIDRVRSPCGAFTSRSPRRVGAKPQRPRPLWATRSIPSCPGSPE